MRIVAKIATAGDAGLSRFPTIPDDAVISGPDGKADYALLLKALKMDQVQIGGNDGMEVLVFGAAYMMRVTAMLTKITERINADGDYGAYVGADSTGGVDRADKCDRNIRKGRFVFCRTDITWCLDGIHAKLSVQNPRNVVGAAEQFAVEYAVVCARVLVGMRNEMRTADVTIIEGEGCGGVTDAAKTCERVAVALVMARNCRHRISGYCSPICPECQLYDGGRCNPDLAERKA